MSSSLDELTQMTRYAIADQFHINVSYLSKRFKEETGSSVLNFIDQEKMYRAKMLIESMDGVTIEDISKLVGIAKTNQFRGKFKRIFYVTPGKYRKIKKGRHFGPEPPRPQDQRCNL